MKRAGLFLGIAFATVASIRAAMASPIIYIDSGIGSGFLKGVSFTDSLVTVSFIGDTDNITFDGTMYKNVVGTASVTVNGVTDTLIGGIGYRGHWCLRESRIFNSCSRHRVIDQLGSGHL